MFEWLSLEQFNAAMQAVSAIATAITAIFALFGLNTWRKQTRENTQSSSALNLMKAIYAYRDTSLSVRNPLVSLSEGGETPDNIPPEEAHTHWEFRAYQKRWDKLIEARTRVSESLVEAEVLWGNDIREKVETIDVFQRELFATIQTYLSRKMRREQRDPWLSEREMSVIYGTWGDSDIFHNELKTKITLIHGFLAKYLNLLR